ncbi:MAG: biopolymer transporter ExbD [Candidatus Krumholzibacteriota bacterium]|nr:biopolymer transporter ExbD [Candidatus Krumholzibacteriota bacterium]
MKKNLIIKRAEIAGINVTPIIDVALVLVIILLITAPVLSVSDLGVNLPRAQTRGVEENDRLSVTISSTGRISVDKEIVPREELVSAIGARLREPDKQNVLVVIRADEDIPYPRIMEILQQVQEAGAHHLAIATTQIGKERKWTSSY